MVVEGFGAKLKRMERRNVNHQLKRLFEGDAMKYWMPLVVMPHPVNVEMIGRDIVDPDERRVELIPNPVGRVGSIALHETVASRSPFSENIHTIVELRRPNFRKEARFHDVADEDLASRDDRSLGGVLRFRRTRLFDGVHPDLVAHRPPSLKAALATAAAKIFMFVHFERRLTAIRRPSRDADSDFSAAGSSLRWAQAVATPRRGSNFRPASRPVR
jgi:hypothetical protein